MTGDKYERRSFQIVPVPFTLCRLTFLSPEGGVAMMAIIMQDLLTRLLEEATGRGTGVRGGRWWGCGSRKDRLEILYNSGDYQLALREVSRGKGGFIQVRRKRACNLATCIVMWA